MSNAKINRAKKAKKDEFYTQYKDIENEVSAYIVHNPDVFKGKTILCPCDNPDKSNFTKYFIDHFKEYGLKKLISTCYTDPNNSSGRYFIMSDNGKVDYGLLTGNGDFRSEEVTKLRDESDIIITNPPFSLFREFLKWIIDANKQFLIIGNQNAIACKEVFPLIKDNKIRLGATYLNDIHEFRVSDNYPLNASSFRIDKNGNKYIRVNGIRWFTNLDYGYHCKPLMLTTMKENIHFSEHKEIRKNGYQKYDNYDAIDVPFVNAIPSDYYGTMGVPITFLDKYCPEQFEILEGSNRYGILNTWGMNDSIRERHSHGNNINGKATYFRVHIRKKATT